MVLTHQTIDEHNDIIAGDIITIQTKCPAIQNLTGHLCPDRINVTIGRFNRILSDAVITVKPITDPEKIGPKD